MTLRETFRRWLDGETRGRSSARDFADLMTRIRERPSQARRLVSIAAATAAVTAAAVIVLSAGALRPRPRPADSKAAQPTAERGPSQPMRIELRVVDRPGSAMQIRISARDGR